MVQDFTRLSGDISKFYRFKSISGLWVCIIVRVLGRKGSDTGNSHTCVQAKLFSSSIVFNQIWIRRTFDLVYHLVLYKSE